MKTILVLSGSGLSTESGIPTFRGAGGLWEGVRVEDVASPKAWAVSPAEVLRFYAHRFRVARAAQPNAAHLALSRLESAHRVIHSTQNVDDLLERAGCTEVYHLHGQLDRDPAPNAPSPGPSSSRSLWVIDAAPK